MVTRAQPGNPIARGIGLAALAAVLFGATAPLLQGASRGLNALAAAAFLYLGAGGLALGIRSVRRGKSQEAALERSDLPRVLVVAVLGAVAGPALLVHGLERTDAGRASLLLVLEAPLTALLAAALFREYVSRRVWLAVAAISAGAVLLAYPGPVHQAARGDVFIVLACLAWALDNTIARKLADRDPLSVVAAKGLLGGALSLAVALPAGWVTVTVGSALRLLALGAVGYGLSLELYLRAQRVVGTARTASVFATAPFIGVAVAIATGTPWPGPAFALAAVLMAVGIWLHSTEHHRHAHSHLAVDHDHLHVHDDGHHGHAHDPMPGGPHAHRHHHEPVTHEHEHGEDADHRHVH
jgi:drug/metabolite transporter (DMT)-like permease